MRAHNKDNAPSMNSCLPLDDNVAKLFSAVEELWDRAGKTSDKTAAVIDEVTKIITGEVGIGLSDYLYKPGIAGGQVANGGTLSNEAAQINGSVHANKGPVGLNVAPTTGWGSGLGPVQFGKHGSIWGDAI